ncbi:MAG: NIPSNAP family protein [Actinomycetota bacterium]
MTVAEAVLEIRTYRLLPGVGEEFHRIFQTLCGPLLRHFGIDVVRFGPSEQDEDGARDYLLMRAFDSVAARDEQEARFYGSSDWQTGPRHDVLSRIESYHTVVLTVAVDALDGLRQPPG